MCHSTVIMGPLIRVPVAETIVREHWPLSSLLSCLFCLDFLNVFGFRLPLTRCLMYQGPRFIVGSLVVADEIDHQWAGSFKIFL